MSLKDLDIKKVYKSLQNNVVKDFYIPVLRESILYKRAAGFFNSAALYEIATGIQYLIKNGGKIQLIVSPKLNEEDVDAIIKGYKTREEIINNALLREIKEPVNVFQQKKLNLLANLIAEGNLDIKVAFKQDANSIGIFHEKIGIMQDSEGNKVAFGGSMNETYSGYLYNYESIDVYRSWLFEDEERVILKEKDFDELWSNLSTGMQVIEFSKVVIEKLNGYKKESNDEIILKYGESEELNSFDIIKPVKPKMKFFRFPELDPDFKGLFDYQEKAAAKWLENNAVGIFNMATGTGKTLTALGSLTYLAQKQNDKFCVFIVCPYQHLVEQWVEDIEKFGVKPLVAYSSKSWKTELKNLVIDYNLKIIDNFCVVTTNATFVTKEFQDQVDKIKRDICLVVDEAHNFGAPKQIKCMKEKIKFRLALSATLDRHHDEYGTKKLREYFGEECINYSLQEAIDNNKLTPYYYHPIPVHLTSLELNDYNELSEKISKIMRNHKGKDGEDLPEVVKRLLIKRSRIIAGAKNKTATLIEIMKPLKNDKNILIYCGATKSVNYIEHDESFEDEEFKQYDLSDRRSIEEIVDLLGNKLKMKVHQFTAMENAKQREIIKDNFKAGILQCLVAIKCLDEGMNIPGINTAIIMASSTNPKEYIQRRGRVLRKAKNKDFAVIFDFITLPRPFEEYIDPETEKYEISLVKKEFDRIDDFRALCLNPSEAFELEKKIISYYNMDIIKGENY